MFGSDKRPGSLLLRLTVIKSFINNHIHSFPWDVIIPPCLHYNDVIMTTIASQITSLAVVYSTVYSDADHRKHQSSASLAFVWGIHRGPVNSRHKWPVTRKMFPFDDVIMSTAPVVEVTSRIKNHIPWFDKDNFPYTCLKLDAGKANLC